MIRLSRVHLYKPIQIAEILYHARVHQDVNLDDVESYRNQSKKWRDDISKILLGTVCTSSARFQDDLFNENALPPRHIKTLSEENIRTKGAVEAYIYNQFTNRRSQLSGALAILKNATYQTFNVTDLIDSFWKQPGLKRSLDKVYEVIVFSLFSTLVEAMKLKVEVSIDASFLDMLSEFSEFASKVMCLDVNATSYQQEARVYRLGVTNAADRGLDMYSNWGPAIQIKHLSLDEELAHEIVTNISSDRIVIVCKDAEKGIILSLLTQIGWRSRIQSIVTETDLVKWYDIALRGKYSDITGKELLNRIRTELVKEFPSINNTPAMIADRHYEKISSTDW